MHGRMRDGDGEHSPDGGSIGEIIAPYILKRAMREAAIRKLAYEFDEWGRMHSITYPDLEKVTYRYDWGGLVKQVYGQIPGQTEMPFYISRMNYDKFGQRVYVDRMSATQVYYTYDPVTRRLTNIKSDNGGLPVIQDVNFTYDEVDNIVGLTNNATDTTKGGPSSQTFTYNDLYRLKTASGTYETKNKYTLAMDYDNIHNITRKNQRHWLIANNGSEKVQTPTTYDWTYAYGSTKPHAPTQIGTTAYSYDANGNQSGFVAPSLTRTINWDEENRIDTLADGGSTSDYVYDYNNQRVIKRTSQGETVYVNQFYTIRNGTVETKHIFVGNDRVASKVHTDRTNDTYFYHPDHLGSTNTVTDGTGAIYEHIEYFPHGEIWVNDRSRTEPTPYTFTSKELDSETGLYFFGPGRYYDARTAVWQSADPAFIRGEYFPTGDKERDKHLPGIGGVLNPKNLSLYAYGHLDPVKLRDPDGNVVPIVAAIAAYVEAVIAAPDFAADVTVLSIDLARGDTAAVVGDLVGLGVPGLPNIVTRAGAKGMEKLIAQHGDEIMDLANRIVKRVDELKGASGLSKEAQRGIKTLEKRIAEHAEKLNEFKKNPTIRPGMENMSKEAIKKQQAARIKHLEKEIQTFKENIEKLKSGE